MDRMVRRRVVVSLALTAFLCAAALAVADVARIGPLWTVKSDPDPVVRVDEPAELPPPLEEEPHVPAAPAADEPKSCVGDATCVKPDRRKDREDGKDGDSDRKREERDAEEEQDRTDEDAGPRDGADERGTELIAGTLEALADLGEEGLIEAVLPDGTLPAPLCGDADECLALFADMLGERDEAEDVGEAPLLARGIDGDGATLLDELLGCDSLEACEELYFGAIVPEDHAGEVDDAVDPVLEVELDHLGVLIEPDRH